MDPEADMRSDSPRLRMLCGAGMIVLALVSVLVTWPYVRETPGLNPVNLVGLGIMETITVALAVMVMSGRAGRKKIRLTLTRSRWRIYNLIGVAAVFLPLTILALGSPRMLPVVGLGPLLVALGLALILEPPRSSAPVTPPTAEQVAASRRLLMPLLVLGSVMLAASIVLWPITGTIDPLMLLPVGLFFLVIGIAPWMKTTKGFLVLVLSLGMMGLVGGIVLGLAADAVYAALLIPVGVVFLIFGIAVQIAAAKQRKNHQAARHPDTGIVPP
ncbi:hypothetical protein AB4Z38_10305 [Arthrobacter sp. 2RAF6]|uniref:hypothetical protein n=1 Tax=Arthrobacter sp. 2RAF6 TaxID=3233002 RepID=UPI003F8DB19F